MGTEEILILRSKLLKVEASHKKVIKENQIYLASAEEKLRLEKQVETLTRERRLLEESLSKTKNDILRQQKTIQRLSNSLREIGSTKTTLASPSTESSKQR